MLYKSLELPLLYHNIRHWYKTFFKMNAYQVLNLKYEGILTVCYKLTGNISWKMITP